MLSFAEQEAEHYEQALRARRLLSFAEHAPRTTLDPGGVHFTKFRWTRTCVREPRRNRSSMHSNPLRGQALRIKAFGAISCALSGLFTLSTPRLELIKFKNKVKYLLEHKRGYTPK